MSYPILLHLRGRRVVVVGGGKVGTRKVIDLLNEEALVTVISPEVHFAIAPLGDRDDVDMRLTEYAAGMLAEIDPLLVFAATDNPEVNRQVADEARTLGILVNTTNDGKAGDFTNMAKIERGEITIGLATGGAVPALTAHLRAVLENSIGEEYATLARWLGELRPHVKADIAPEKRRELWQAILDSAVLDCLRSGDEVGARAMIDQLIAEASSESD